VEETDDRGRKTRTTEARDNRRGIPQGSPISPLLANIYMRRLVLGWKKLGLEQRLGSRIVTYADDLVILCKKMRKRCMVSVAYATQKANHTVDPRKSRIRHLGRRTERPASSCSLGESVSHRISSTSSCGAKIYGAV